MLAYSDNYKHNNLIYSQVVVIDVTTNGSTILENPEAGIACKKQRDILRGVCRAPPLLFPHRLPPIPTQVFLGWSGKQGEHMPQTLIIRQPNAHQPRSLDFSVEMAVPPGGKECLDRNCERFFILSNKTITGAVFNHIFVVVIELIQSHCRRFGKHKKKELIQ